MRPDIDISYQVNGEIKDYAAERGLSVSEAYRQIIRVGLAEMAAAGDTGGTIKGAGDDNPDAAWHADHDDEATEAPPDRSSTPLPASEDCASASHAIVDEVASGWDEDGRLDARRAAATTAVDLLLERGQLSKSVAVDELLPEHAVEGQSPETWWRKNVRPVVREAATYSKGVNAYVVDEE